MKENLNGKVTIIDALCESKTGDNTRNEDTIVINDSFVAVFDGATSVKDLMFEGQTGGRIASQFLGKCLESDEFIQYAKELDGKAFADKLQEALKEYVVSKSIPKLGIATTAVGVIYNIEKQQLIVVGDCQFMLNGELHTFSKKFDEVFAEARAVYIQMLLQEGYTEDDLLVHDKGRECIRNSQRMQHYVENKNCEYGYTAFSNLRELIDVPVYDVPSGSEVVLASDGYFTLCNTLEESESKLREQIKEDPLFYKTHKSTKGIVKPNKYPDDRSYIRFTVQ